MREGEALPVDIGQWACGNSSACTKAKQRMEEPDSKPKAKGRKPNKRRNRNKSRGPPPTPSLKIVLRNLRLDLDHLVEFVTELVDRSNEKLAFKMSLNKEQLEALVQDQKTALETAEQFKQQQSNPPSEPGEDGEKANEESPPAASAPTNNASAQSSQYLQAAKVPRTFETPDPNSIATSVLYFLPPKSSARRGAIPGTLYMVLMAPELETIKSISEGEPAPGSTGPPSVDYSRAIAKRKLQLAAALDAMQSTKPDLDIHEAVNNKTWRIDEHETTTNFLETDDYKEYLETAKVSEEERNNRPKPAPGGGLQSAAAAADPPVAALVLHLQKKLELEKKRKQARRKESKKKKAASSNNNNNKIRKRGRKKKRPPKQPNGTAAPASGGG